MIKYLILISVFIGAFALADSTSFDLSNLKKLNCQNELGSHFVFEIKANKASGSFLGRRDDLDYSGFIVDGDAKFEVHRDYIRQGLIGVTIRAKNEYRY